MCRFTVLLIESCLLTIHRFASFSLIWLPMNSNLTSASALASRYEVKFVVDGNWQLAPSWPVVGDGLSANNLLVVD